MFSLCEQSVSLLIGQRAQTLIHRNRFLARQGRDQSAAPLRQRINDEYEAALQNYALIEA
jgi:hypothetical protein